MHQDTCGIGSAFVHGDLDSAKRPLPCSAQRWRADLLATGKSGGRGLGAGREEGDRVGSAHLLRDRLRGKRAVRVGLCGRSCSLRCGFRAFRSAGRGRGKGDGRGLPHVERDVSRLHMFAAKVSLLGVGDHRPAAYRLGWRVAYLGGSRPRACAPCPLHRAFCRVRWSGAPYHVGFSSASREGGKEA